MIELQGQPGAESMLGAMKGGVEKAAGTAGGAVGMAGSVTEKIAQAGLKHAKKTKQPPLSDADLTAKLMEEELARQTQGKGKGKSEKN